jgi:hypothetical protein
MRYRAIQDHADRLPVRLMCRALKVSAAGYYAGVARPEAERTKANRRLLVEIRAAHERSDRTCTGAPASTAICARPVSAVAKIAWRGRCAQARSVPRP